MNRANRTCVFVLIMMIHQVVLSFFWYSIVMRLSLDFVGQMIATQLLVFILPIIIFMFFIKEPIKEVFSLNPLGFKNFLLVVVISIFIQPTMSFLSVISTFLFPNEVSAILSDINTTPLWQLVIAMAVMPCICEELFFRGLTFSGFKNVGIKKACVMTGLLFGLMHLDGQQFLYAFAMGIVFCYMVYKTKSIFASMLSHFIINASQISMSWISYRFYEMNQLQVPIGDPTFQDMIITIIAVVVLMVISLPILILAFWGLHKINKPAPNPITDTEIPIMTEDIFNYAPIHEEKVLNLPFFLILALYSIIVILIPILNSLATI